MKPKKTFLSLSSRLENSKVTLYRDSRSCRVTESRATRRYGSTPKENPQPPQFRRLTWDVDREYRFLWVPNPNFLRRGRRVGHSIDHGLGAVLTPPLFRKTSGHQRVTEKHGSPNGTTEHSNQPSRKLSPQGYGSRRRTALNLFLRGRTGLSGTPGRVPFVLELVPITT